MYKFKMDMVGKNKRIVLRNDGKFCSIYVARPDEFAEIPEIKRFMVNHHRKKVKCNGI